MTWSFDGNLPGAANGVMDRAAVNASAPAQRGGGVSYGMVAGEVHPYPTRGDAVGVKPSGLQAVPALYNGSLSKGGRRRRRHRHRRTRRRV